MTKRELKYTIQQILEDLIPNGRGDDTDVSTINNNELAVGIEVELEHTSDRNIAIEIAIDHLTEVPDYYSKLIKAGLVDEKPALKLYKVLFSN